MWIQCLVFTNQLFCIQCMLSFCNLYAFESHSLTLFFRQVCRSVKEMKSKKGGREREKEKERALEQVGVN